MWLSAILCLVMAPENSSGESSMRFSSLPVPALRTQRGIDCHSLNFRALCLVELGLSAASMLSEYVPCLTVAIVKNYVTGLLCEWAHGLEVVRMNEGRWKRICVIIAE